MQGIADYEFVRQIGESNYGENFLALAPARLGIPADHVVVKVISGSSGDDAFRRATRELKHFSLARSDKLVTLYDAGRQGGSFFYAMEYLPGGTLEAPETPLDRAASIRAVADASRAAHALHEVGIAHRDIKPANILLHEGGAKLSDLGLSQLLSPGLVFTGLMNIGLEYTDPAILVGAEASRATDIWSLAASLHFALTGATVYSDVAANDPLLLMRAIVSSKPTLSDNLDPAARALIERCFNEDLSERPATAEQVAEELEQLTG
jgi:serine/threonine protein kinase